MIRDRSHTSAPGGSEIESYLSRSSVVINTRLTPCSNRILAIVGTSAPP